jgi:nicotinamidase-related amidase
MVKELTGPLYRQKYWKLYPARSALLVLDMQNYFLDKSSHAFTPSAPAIIPNINRLIDLAVNHNMAIIFTKHVNDASNAGRMNKWWRDMIEEGSREAEIHKTVRLYDGKTIGGGSPTRDDSMVGREAGEHESPARDGSLVGKIFVKNQYDAFYNTDLEEYLKSRGIEQVIITGVLTNLCCETTARSAFVKGFEVLFPLDATAAYNKEFHLSTFRNLGFGFCPIITTADLINS